VPRHGGSGGRWVTKGSGKSRHIGRGKGRQRAATIPPSSAQFPQIKDPFKDTSVRPSSKTVADTVRLPRRKRSPAGRAKTLDTPQGK